MKLQRTLLLLIVLLVALLSCAYFCLLVLLTDDLPCIASKGLRTPPAAKDVAIIMLFAAVGYAVSKH